MRILGVTASSILKVTSSYESIASATGTGSSNNSGGVGASNAISGIATTYAAGGIGDRTITPENGASNTGNGGAGNNANATAGSGGSGIVIVRYRA